MNNVLRNSTPYKSWLALTSARSLFRELRASATAHGAEPHCPTWWLQWNEQRWLSVSSPIHNRSWALISKAEITKPLQRLSTWIISVFKADSLRKSSLVQRGGSGSSNCWRKGRCRQIYQLSLWASYTSSAPCSPHCRACTPQWSPSPGDALNPHALAQQLILPVFNIFEQSEVLMHNEWDHREPSHSAAHILGVLLNISSLSLGLQRKCPVFNFSDSVTIIQPLCCTVGKC